MCVFVYVFNRMVYIVFFMRDSIFFCLVNVVLRFFCSVSVIV